MREKTYHLYLNEEERSRVMAVCTLLQLAFRSISQNAPTEQSQQKRTQLIVNLAELEYEPVRILVEIIMV